MREPTSEEREWIETLTRLCASARGVPLGHLRVRTGARVRDVLIGEPGADTSVVDWRTSPIAEVFFSTRVGDEYELEIGDRLVEGVLLARHLLGREPREIVGETATLTETAGKWIAIDREPMPLEPREPGARLERRLEVVLDPTQRAAVELALERSMLVRGEAGFGKTTVALHRLARAVKEQPGLRALVLAPTEGLARLSTRILERLGATDVEVRSVDRWLVMQAKRCFDLPARESRDATAAVVRLKRHPALREVLPEIARGEGSVEIGLARRGAHATREDLLHLFGDRELMRRVAERASLGAGAVAQIVEHTRVQFSERAEDEHAHVDADRLLTLDGASIDEGTPMQDAGTFDVEDCAVLFAIQRARAGREKTSKGKLACYDRIVVDEAQELSPLELAVIGRARAEGGAITVAGDEHQRTDDTACFGGWPETMLELSLERWEDVRLLESHRCPPEVTELARGVFGAPVSEAALRSRTVVRTRVASELHLCAIVTDGILRLLDEDPRASIAVLTRTPERAREIERLLSRGLPTRLVLEGDFSFEPGIDVTTVSEIKGLEVDYAVIPDASANGYPREPEAQRALYVALTRAAHRVWLLASGEWSPLLAR